MRKMFLIVVALVVAACNENGIDKQMKSQRIEAEMYLFGDGTCAVNVPLAKDDVVRFYHSSRVVCSRLWADSLKTPVERDTSR